MVLQFVLQETITGQENQLTELSAEVSALADALGLEQDRSATLGTQVGALSTELSGLQTALGESEAAIEQQNAMIARLTVERDSLIGDVSSAQSRITGFEAQVAGLLEQRRDAEGAISGLEAREAELVSDQEALNLAIAQARTEIDAGAEAARLAAARREALEAMIASLETDNTSVNTQIAALETAGVVAAARMSELEVAGADANARIVELEASSSATDAQITGLEVARAGANAQIAELQASAAATEVKITGLEAARAAANAQIVGLEASGAATEAQIAELEAARAAALVQISETEVAMLVDAAAAQALRERLANADTELTAMTLALEERRQAAEDTLTLLAAAQTARHDLDQNLAIVLLAQQEAEAAAQALGLERGALADRLAAALGEQGETAQTLEALRGQLAAALIARTGIEQELSSAAAQRDTFSDDLAAAVAALATAQAQTGVAGADADRKAALLALANNALTQEQALSSDNQRQVALLNEQVAALRGEMGRLQALLNLENDADVMANVQIETLTQNLNTAMARALLAERRARVLEEAELERMAAEAVELERYRSDFLGLLRNILEDVDGVRIQGDRFVFSSEVLFEQGAAQLSGEGQREIAKVATILRDVAGDIPESIDWVIRVDGHTDNVPLSGAGEFANNWELSQARALSVVLYMVNFLAIPPERLAANGFGQYQPINPANTTEARAQNRRIELKLTER
ncbi:putative OmpA-like protein [Octadecabacter antarcticus 307]|uniref:Putative OmpA-like protein n=2 Tax=Octadecabacter TaxID=53945 RepID=M9RA33_9RHOB|nr:putative OmpA-like protein [Octadecabacter antarcticus 307]